MFELNRLALSERIQFILDIAKDNQVDTLILGAFGCGAFGQNPELVASIFKEKLEKTFFKKIVFAIPDFGDGNLQVFKTVFTNE